jgi:hypothetical protein
MYVIVYVCRHFLGLQYPWLAVMREVEGKANFCVGRQAVLPEEGQATWIKKLTGQGVIASKII